MTLVVKIKSSSEKQTMTKNFDNLPEEKKRLLRGVLMMTGLFFFMIGMALVAFPTYGEIIFGAGEEQTTRIFGSALVLVGITDVFIAKFLFGESTK